MTLQILHQMRPPAHGPSSHSIIGACLNVVSLLSRQCKATSSLHWSLHLPLELSSTSINLFTSSFHVKDNSKFRLFPQATIHWTHWMLFRTSLLSARRQYRSLVDKWLAEWVKSISGGFQIHCRLISSDLKNIYLYIIMTNSCGMKQPLFTVHGHQRALTVDALNNTWYSHVFNIAMAANTLPCVIPPTICAWEARLLQHEAAAFFGTFTNDEVRVCKHTARLSPVHFLYRR